MPTTDQLQAQLDALSNTVATKADTDPVTTLQNQIAAKANQSDLILKANQTDLDALTTTVSGKASQASVDALTTTVAGKADHPELDALRNLTDGTFTAELDGRYGKQPIIDAIQSEFDAKADVTALSAETTRAQNAETALQSGKADVTALTAETTRAQNAEALLQSKSSLEADVAAKIGTSGALDTALSGAYASNPVVGYSDLLPWFVALGGRETKRANVVMIGASVTEGVGVTADQTQAQRLATTLRGRFPTKGLTSGGRGHIGQPASATSYPWTYGTQGTLAASVWDETFNVGANHRTRVLKGDGSAVNYNWTRLTLSGSITSFDISHVKTAFGGTNYGYYKIDGGAAVAFSTYAATPTPELLHISAAATSTIEIGCLTGSLYFDGIVEYNGDENKGIQVHNCGHGSYTAANWNTGFTAGCWAYSIAALAPDLLIISDLGVNDYVTTIGNKTSVQFKTDLLALIANLRTAGVTCPILLAANYKVDYSGYTYVEPWANYVAAMKAVADADSTISFVDHSARMPSTSNNTLGIIGADQIHPTAKGYGLMADTLMSVIGSR